MTKYSKEDIINLVKENGVKFIRLQFTDIFGSLKNVAITDKQLEKALNNECMFDGSSIDGFVFFFLNWWILALPLPLIANTALYIFTMTVGYIVSLR